MDEKYGGSIPFLQFHRSMTCAQHPPTCIDESAAVYSCEQRMVEGRI